MARVGLRRPTTESDAIREKGDAIYVRVQVRPGAPETCIGSAKGSARGSIRIDVAARPEAGAANRTLCAFLERQFGRDVRVFVVHGLTSRRKTLLIAGATRDRVAQVLAGERA
jgi:uncharacterized protein (TIGR00251 family)